MKLSVSEATHFAKTVIFVDCKPENINFDVDISAKNVIPVDISTPPALLPVLSVALQDGHALVVSKSQEVHELCASLNKFPGYKIAFWDGSKLDTASLLKELEKIAVCTADGSQYLPEGTDIPAVFTTADGRVLLSGGTVGGEKLCQADGTTWGILLPEWVGMTQLIGTLDACRTTLTPEEQDVIYTQLCTDETCAVPKEILIFRDENNLLALSLPDTEYIPSADMKLYLHTGMMPDKPVGEILSVLCTLPDLRKASALAEQYCTAVFA